jgi:hypothetical protein
MEYNHLSCHQHNRPMQPTVESLAAEIRLEEELLSPHQVAPHVPPEIRDGDARCDRPPSVVIEP